MKIEMKPIGFLQSEVEKVPRHWSVSDLEGALVIDEKYIEGLKDMGAGQRIVVLFHFHKSPAFDRIHLTQTPPHCQKNLGVFSICSPNRPNPIGMSVLEVLDVSHNIIRVRGVDMLPGTPILDIKPYVEKKHDCPSCEGERCPDTP